MKANQISEGVDLALQKLKTVEIKVLKIIFDQLVMTFLL